MVAVHAAVSWLNRHEPRLRQRRMLELHLHRERSDNYRKVRDAVKYVIDTPARMNEQLYLELLAAKRVALHLAQGTVALLDTSDDAAWKVRIVRELPPDAPDGSATAERTTKRRRRSGPPRGRPASSFNAALPTCASGGELQDLARRARGPGR